MDDAIDFLMLYDGHFAPLQLYFAAATWEKEESPFRNMAIHEVSHQPWKVSADSSVSFRVVQAHTRPILHLSLSDDGQKLASASVDCAVKVWETQSGACERTLEGHTCAVNIVGFSPNGKLIASGDWDFIMRLWNAQNGDCLGVFEGHEGVIRTVAFSPDGQVLASGSKDGTVKVWESRTEACQRTLEGHGGFVNIVRFSPNGKFIASGSSDKTARLWDVQNGTCVFILEGHEDKVKCIAFSLDSRLVVSCCCSGETKFWDTRTGQCRRTIPTAVGSGFLPFSMNGQYLEMVRGTIDMSCIDSAISAKIKPRRGFHAGWNSYECDGRELIDIDYFSWPPVIFNCYETQSMILGSKSGQIWVLHVHYEEIDE